MATSIRTIVEDACAGDELTERLCDAVGLTDNIASEHYTDDDILSLCRDFAQWPLQSLVSGWYTPFALIYRRVRCPALTDRLDCATDAMDKWPLEYIRESLAYHGWPLSKDTIAAVILELTVSSVFGDICNQFDAARQN